ncbi:cysteine hydrolase family protein [Undibacterium sp. TS12]|uniref:cysteine hydrolase family protein n=1 Tax=Undibacterium sp. TS12 TaxID=2908202 RepID=UPI001F4CECAE|nr:cysteine hydrolase family protein [Undibacterium sp. TS12]MCH8621373.1 cysteine hydrolase [Undibacterium sp. TS12]
MSTANKPTIKRALIVVDVQNEYFTGDLLIEYPDPKVSLRNIGRAMDAATAAGIPVLKVQHSAPETAPIFARGSHNWQLHEVVASRPASHHIEKKMASVFTGTDAATWLKLHDINTITIVGYMTHNCNASTIFEAAHNGYEVEVLHDASGSLPYENAAGYASAEEIHRAFSVVFHSNFAAVSTTDGWIEAVQAGVAIEKGNVYASNLAGRAHQAA